MKTYTSEKEDKSTAVRIPKGLIRNLEEFLKTDYAKKQGYHHKSDVVSDAVRELLEKHKPRFGHIIRDDSAIIIDYTEGNTSYILFRENGSLWCDKDKTESCPHIKYALTIPSILKKLKAIC